MVWYSHLLKNFPQFIVIHTVKGFDMVNKAEIDVFWELSCFFHDPADVGNLISVFVSHLYIFFGEKSVQFCGPFFDWVVYFSETSLNIREFTVHVLLKSGLDNFENYFSSV